MQQLHPLLPYFQSQRGRAREVTAGSPQTRDKSEVDRVTRCEEDNWNCLSRCLCRQNRGGGWRNNYCYLATNKLGSQFRQSVVATLGPPIFDRRILTLGKACRFQAQAERTQPICVRIG